MPSWLANASATVAPTFIRAPRILRRLIRGCAVSTLHRARQQFLPHLRLRGASGKRAAKGPAQPLRPCRAEKWRRCRRIS
eukprot:1934483-Lingulodinium_polyedra.AAC.1